MENDIEKFENLNMQLKDLETKKIRLEEQFKAKKKELTETVNDIKKEGYDPNKLKEIIAEKEEELKKKLSKFEKDVKKASEELSEIEE